MLTGLVAMQERFGRGDAVGSSPITCFVQPALDRAVPYLYRFAISMGGSQASLSPSTRAWRLFLPPARIWQIGGAAPALTGSKFSRSRHDDYASMGRMSIAPGPWACSRRRCTRCLLRCARDRDVGNCLAHLHVHVVRLTIPEELDIQPGQQLPIQDHLLDPLIDAVGVPH